MNNVRKRLNFEKKSEKKENNERKATSKVKKLFSKHTRNSKSMKEFRTM